MVRFLEFLSNIGVLVQYFDLQLHHHISKFQVCTKETKAIAISSSTTKLLITARKLGSREGNVFTPVCKSFCSQGACVAKWGWRAWQRGACVVKWGMCGEGGHVWQRGLRPWEK